MDPKHLSVDEIEVECLVRNISGSIFQQLEILTAVIKSENEGTATPPDKTHVGVRKSPQKELDNCSHKLRNLKPQVQEIVDLNMDERGNKLAILSTHILHVTGRLQRLANSSPSCKKPAQNLLIACDKMLQVIQSLVESKVSVNEFEKSVSEAMPDDNTVLFVSPPISEISDSSDTELALAHKKIGSNFVESKTEVNDNRSATHKILTTTEYNDLIKIINKLSITNPILSTNDTEKDLPVHTTSTPQNNCAVQQVPSVTDRKIGVTSSVKEDNKNSSLIVGIHKWNIFYDGSPTGPTIERFFYRVERLSCANKISRERLVSDLYLLLRKSALEWYWSFLERKGDIGWEDLKQGMLERFRDRRTDAEIKQMVASIKQKPDECFMDFYHKVIDASLSLSTPLSDSDLYFILKRNMVNPLQYKIAGRQIGSVIELVHQCVEIEDTWKRLNADKFGRPVGFRQVHEFVTDTDRSNFPNTGSAGIAYTNHVPYFSSYVEEYQHPTFVVNPHSSGNTYYNNSPNDYYRQVNAMGTTNPPYKITPHNPTRVDLAQYHDQNLRNTNTSRQCYGCGAPNVIKPNCRVCNQTNKENSRGEVRIPGSQPTPNLNILRRQTEDVASNTCPELYRRNQ